MSWAPASEYARNVDRLTLGVGLVTGITGLLVIAALVFLAWRYRSGAVRDRRAPPDQSVTLEILWTAIPFVVFLVFFVKGATAYVAFHREAPGAHEIAVLGRRWMWEFHHPGGRKEIDELHVPEGEPVRLTMISEDVIHSLFVPALRIKQDVLPGRYTTLGFTADRVDSLPLFCAEYCGTDHARMAGRVIVMPAAEYAAWSAGGSPALDPAAEGAQLFERLGCATCHRADGHGIGPSLEGLEGRTVRFETGESIVADATYLRDSILRPAHHVVAGWPAVMPSFTGQVDEAQLLALVAYLESRATRPAPEAHP